MKSEMQNKKAALSEFRGDAGLQNERFDQALRTYASWLARAALRKTAQNTSENTPYNSPGIDLTSGP